MHALFVGLGGEILGHFGQGLGITPRGDGDVLVGGGKFVAHLFVEEFSGLVVNHMKGIIIRNGGM